MNKLIIFLSTLTFQKDSIQIDNIQNREKLVYSTVYWTWVTTPKQNYENDKMMLKFLDNKFLMRLLYYCSTNKTMSKKIHYNLSSYWFKFNKLVSWFLSYNRKSSRALTCNQMPEVAKSKKKIVMAGEEEKNKKKKKQKKI